MNLGKKLKEILLFARFHNKWEKCMFGYVLHMDEATIRIYVKKKKEEATS